MTRCEVTGQKSAAIVEFLVIAAIAGFTTAVTLTTMLGGSRGAPRNE